MLKKYLGIIKRKLFKPALLKKKIVSGTSEPRTITESADSNDELDMVWRLNKVNTPSEALLKLEATWNAYYGNIIKPEHRVLIKVNLNTADPYPASSDPEMVAAVVDYLHSKGIFNLLVGDCTSNVTLPTARVAKRTGLWQGLKDKVEFAFFDREPWVEVPIKGEYINRVTVPRRAMEVDRIINLANLKTHCLADYTLGMKLAVGFMHPKERYDLHREYLQEKAVEINLAVPADLTIIDGRCAFITGGPSQGKVVQADIMLFGANQLAVDADAYNVLYELKKEHNCVGDFPEDPFNTRQISHALKVGLGGLHWQGFKSTAL